MNGERFSYRFSYRRFIHNSHREVFYLMHLTRLRCRIVNMMGLETEGELAVWTKRCCVALLRKGWNWISWVLRIVEISDKRHRYWEIRYYRWTQSQNSRSCFTKGWSADIFDLGRSQTICFLFDILFTAFTVDFRSSYQRISQVISSRSASR